MKMAAPARAAKAPTPAELVDKICKDIDVAELRLAQCLRSQAEYAERSVTDPAVMKDYAEATRSVGLVRDEIGRLKIALAGAQERARQQEAERIAREQSALIERIEKKAAERDKLGAELAAAVKIMDEAFRKLITLGRDIAAAWPLGVHDGSACVLTPGAITRALQHEIFRVGSRPHLLGGQDQPDALVHLPGGMSPTLEFINQPDKVTPLVETLAQASRYLSEIMRTGKATAPAATNGAQVEQRQLTAAESKLASLHRRQSELASLPSPTAQQETEYTAVVAEVAKIATAIEAEKAGAQS
jgi:hypothetical protein